MGTYYRLHDPSRCTPEDLLRPEHQVSRVWIGAVELTCDAPGCYEGTVLVDGEEAPCEACRGTGTRYVEEQAGVSVCRSLGDLAAYLLARAPYTEGCVVVELEGEGRDEDDVDAAYGAVLVRPTAIVRVLPVSVLEGLAL